MSTSTPNPQDVVASEITSRFARLASDSTQQISSALRAGTPLVSAWIELLGAAAELPAAVLSSAGRSVSKVLPSSGCCEIPESECPPYCVCDIAWEGTRGEHVNATIGLTNTRKVRQTFTLATTTFAGPGGDSGAKATVSPAEVSINAGESATVTVGFLVPETFGVGDDYNAQVHITGLYEQCVRLKLRVRAVVVPHCAVKQGEIPTRIHAHRWYEHFQCEELCYQPAHSIGVQIDRKTPVHP